MMDILSQAGISEIMLLFVLLFIIPGMVFLLLQLRKYENMFGMLPGGRSSPKKAPEPEAKAMPEEDPPAIRNDHFPYQGKDFLSPGEKSCLIAMHEALGAEVDVFPHVAIWTLIDTTDKTPGYQERLQGRTFDFLVCDRHTGAPLTAVMFNPLKGAPAGPIDELKKICAAAGVNMVFIDPADEYDGKKLKETLGIPDLDL